MNMIFNELLKIVRVDPLPILKEHRFLNKLTEIQMKELFSIGINTDPQVIQYVPQSLRCVSNRKTHERIITKWYYDLWDMVLDREPKLIKKYIGCLHGIRHGHEKLLVHAAEKFGTKFIFNSNDYGMDSKIYTLFDDIVLREKFYMIALKEEYNILSDAIFDMLSDDTKYVGNNVVAVKHFTQNELDDFEFRKKFCKLAVGINGNLIESIRYNVYNTLELCEIAIKTNPESIIHVPVPKVHPTKIIDKYDREYLDYTFSEYKLLCEKAVIYTSLQRFPALSTKFIVTFSKTYYENHYDPEKIIFTKEYLSSLYNLLHNSYALPQLNLLEITANSHEISQIFDVYELIFEYI